MTLLIEGGMVITNNPAQPLLVEGAVAVEGDKIVAVGRAEEVKRNYTAEEIVDARGKLVIPGMVNAHTHLFQVLARGRFAEATAAVASAPTADKDMWLWNILKKSMFPTSAVLTVKDLVAGTHLACVEMVRSGITCVVDNHYGPTDKATVVKLAEALEKFGMRGVIARGFAGDEPKLASKLRIPAHVFKYSSEEELRITEECILEVNRQSSLIQVWPAPLSEMYISPEFYAKTHELAKKYDVGIHTHMVEGTADPKLYVEEYGRRPVELLYELGVLFPKFQMAHGTWLSDVEIELIGKTGATVVHNPFSNALGYSPGVAPIPKLLEKGGNVALGTDGVFENMFEALKMAIGLQRVTHLDPFALPADKVFELATLGGARALGLEKQLGSLEPGKKADLVVVDVKKPYLTPLSREVTACGLLYHLILFGTGTEVDTAVINGKIVLEEGVIKPVDEARVREEAQEAADDLAQRFTEADVL
ncbi:amidohydrolase [Candidatus Hecatella orcuttiae]|uniref:amidohydrolase family protein n=1 Tax=Candidatus Hecatella orcuttiae TaxID=1935119 RepID=UPI002867F7ED|nr:amidohydrolase [Candidatus Hecatella orcuttiae]